MFGCSGVSRGINFIVNYFKHTYKNRNKITKKNSSLSYISGVNKIFSLWNNLYAVRTIMTFSKEQHKCYSTVNAIPSSKI